MYYKLFILLGRQKGPQNNQGPFLMSKSTTILHQFATLRTNTVFAHRSWDKPNIVFRHTLRNKLHHNLDTCSSCHVHPFDIANTSLQNSFL